MKKIVNHISLIVLAFISFSCSTLSDSDPSADFQKGLKLLNEGDVSGADASFSKAIDGEENFSAYFLRAVSKIRQGNYESALLDLDRVIEINPKYDPAYNERAVIKAMNGDSLGALADFDKALYLNPNSSGYRLNRGNLLTELEDYYAALSDFRSSLELEPTNKEAKFNLELIKKKLGM